MGALKTYTLELLVDGRPMTWKVAEVSEQAAIARCVEYWPKQVVSITSCRVDRWEPFGFKK